MYLFHLARVRPSGSNRFNAQWQRSLSTAGPALRQSAIKPARANEKREREGTTTYVLHYGHTATPRHIAARPTRPLSSLSETDGAWRKDERRRKRGREREIVSESALDEEEGTREKTGRTYRRIHFIGRKNPPGNYRQIYADTRRTTIAKGISRSNVGTRETPTGAVREKRGRTWENKARVDDKSRLERARLIGYCKPVFSQMRRNVARGSETGLL